MTTGEAGYARLGPLVLEQDVTRRNALTILFASFWTIGFVTFLNFMNPFLFALLGIPEEEQGSLAGLLVSLQEITQIAICGFIGAWSDRVGRRPIYVGAMVLLAVGFAVYPMASSEAQLIGLRIAYSIGATACTVMLTTCQGEYINDKYRGRWIGIVGFVNALGVVVMVAFFSKLPSYFGELGLSDANALRASFWVCSTAALLLAILLRFGLQAPNRGVKSSTHNVFRQAAKGMTLVKKYPLLGLAYLTSYASKGDLVIVTTFLSLWVTQAGIAAGMSPAEAVARAGMIFGFVAVCGLVWPFVIGAILDRVPRLVGIGISFVIASIGYGSVALIDDPLGPMMWVAAFLLGIGQASAIISAGVLIGQVAPEGYKGTVFGASNLAGSAGIVTLTFFGGLLFDAYGASSPFILVGAMNAFVAVVTWLMYRWLKQTA
ncbi:MAG: MFS transporter [Gammaproteobacteria bacterium]|nr:MFS transporter [Gammaproteobacteria bacterium]MYF67610.1 MFS transporter [Gammaproteobacteria bacterium]MYK36173.1 MFS transporter [Gammaproteobacteria bacterium]